MEALCGLPSLAGWKVAEVPFEEVCARPAQRLRQQEATRSLVCQSNTACCLLRPACPFAVAVTQVAEDVLKRKHLRTTRVVDILPGGRTQEGGSQVIGGDGP